MHSPAIKLDAIRVQTARMMEIYALLKSELEKNTLFLSAPDARAQLDASIDTIRTNMKQLLAVLVAQQEQWDEKESGDDSEARELEELLEAVLEWHTANTKEE